MFFASVCALSLSFSLHISLSLCVCCGLSAGYSWLTTTASRRPAPTNPNRANLNQTKRLRGACSSASTKLFLSCNPSPTPPSHTTMAKQKLQSCYPFSDPTPNELCPDSGSLFSFLLNLDPSQQAVRCLCPMCVCRCVSVCVSLLGSLILVWK